MNRSGGSPPCSPPRFSSTPIGGSPTSFGRTSRSISPRSADSSYYETCCDDFSLQSLLRSADSSRYEICCDDLSHQSLHRTPERSYQEQIDEEALAAQMQREAQMAEWQALLDMPMSRSAGEGNERAGQQCEDDYDEYPYEDNERAGQQFEDDCDDYGSQAQIDEEALAAERQREAQLAEWQALLDMPTSRYPCEDNERAGQQFGDDCDDYGSQEQTDEDRQLDEQMMEHEVRTAYLEGLLNMALEDPTIDYAQLLFELDNETGAGRGEPCLEGSEQQNPFMSGSMEYEEELYDSSMYDTDPETDC